MLRTYQTNLGRAKTPKDPIANATLLIYGAPYSMGISKHIRYAATLGISIPENGNGRTAGVIESVSSAPRVNSRGGIAKSKDASRRPSLWETGVDQRGFASSRPLGARRCGSRHSYFGVLLVSDRLLAFSSGRQEPIEVCMVRLACRFPRNWFSRRIFRARGM